MLLRRTTVIERCIVARFKYLPVMLPWILALVTELPAQAPPPVLRPEIRTSGSGRQVISPDRVIVSISVQVRRRTPSGAGTANAALANAVRSAITALGVPPDSITTQGYSVELSIPHATDTGFVASNTVLVRLRRLALIGRVIDTALTAGATRIAGVQYTADDTRDARRRALEEAVLQARSNAETVARASGGRLGPLITLTTERTSVDSYLIPRDEVTTGASSAEFATTITPGPLQVSAWVEARWVFVPDDR